MQHGYEEDFDVLDVATFFAEHWRALLLAPALAAALTAALLTATSSERASLTLPLPALDDNARVAPLIFETYRSRPGGVSVRTSGRGLSGELTIAATAATREAALQLAEAARADVLRALERSLAIKDDGALPLFLPARDIATLESYVEMLRTQSFRVERTGVSVALGSILAAAVCGVLMWCMVALRDAVKEAKATPEGQRKLARIRAAFWRGD